MTAPQKPHAPVPRASAAAIEAYTPGKAPKIGGSKTFKLSSNETPLGPSPKAIEAFRNAAGALEVYPDGTASALREAIAARYNLDPERIVCGAGSDDLLHLLASAYLNEGDEAIYTEHGFSMYPIVIQAAGGVPVVARETAYTTDVDKILACLTERTRMVFIANPNNPTGTYIGIDEVKRLHAALPAHVMLVLDAAYGEYVSRNDYADGMELAARYDNVVLTRTFSKIFGLAALRIGWSYASPDVCAMLHRLRGPFNINGPAIAAGVAAINDVDHLNAAAAHNARWLPWVSAEIEKIGFRVTPSVGNFILIHFPGAPGQTAEDADVFLAAHGVVLRAVAGYGLPACLRMTIGTEEANRLTVDLLRRFKDGAGRDSMAKGSA